jgi:hypothetical protein
MGRAREDRVRATAPASSAPASAACAWGPRHAAADAADESGDPRAEAAVSGFEDSFTAGDFLGHSGAVGVSDAPDMGHIDITPPPPPPPPPALKGVVESSGGDAKDPSCSSRSTFCLLVLSMSRFCEAPLLDTHRRYQNRRKNTSVRQSVNATGGTMAEASMALCELYRRACARVGKSKAGEENREGGGGVKQFICFSAAPGRCDGRPRTGTNWSRSSSCFGYRYLRGHGDEMACFA